METQGMNYWADSIANVIRKTEMNIMLLQQKPAVGLTYESSSRPPSSQMHQVPVLEPDTPTDKYKSVIMLRDVEQVVNQRMHSIHGEIEHIHGRLNQIDEKLYAIDKDRSQFLTFVRENESNILTMIRKIFDELNDYMKKSEFKLTEESLRTLNLQDVNRLEGKLSEYTNKYEDISYKFDKVIDQRINEMKKELVSVTKLDTFKLEIMNETMDSTHKALATLKEGVEDNQFKVYNYQKGMFEAVENFINNEIISEISKLNSSMKEIKDQFGSNEQSREREMKFIKEQMNSRGAGDYHELQQSLQDSQWKLQETQKSIQQITNSNKKLTEQNSTLQRKFDEMFREVQQVHETINNLQSDFQVVKLEVEIAQKDLEMSQRNNENYQETYHNQIKQIQDIRKTSSELSEQLKHLQQTKATNQVIQSSSSSEQYQEILKRLSVVDDLIQQVNELEQKLKVKDDTELRTQVNQIKTQNQHQLQQIQTFTQRLAQIESDVSQVQDLDQLQTQFKQEVAIRQELEVKQSELEERIMLIEVELSKQPFEKESSESPPGESLLPTFTKTNEPPAQVDQLNPQIDQGLKLDDLKNITSGSSQEPSPIPTPYNQLKQQPKLLEGSKKFDFDHFESSNEEEHTESEEGQEEYEGEGTEQEWAASFAEQFILGEMDRGFGVVIYTTQMVGMGSKFDPTELQVYESDSGEEEYSDYEVPLPS